MIYKLHQGMALIIVKYQQINYHKKSNIFLYLMLDDSISCTATDLFKIRTQAATLLDTKDMSKVSTMLFNYSDHVKV